MTREDSNLIRTLQNIANSPIIGIKFRKIDNASWYWAMTQTGKVRFFIKRVCDVSSGHPVFSYVIKYNNTKTTGANIGDAVFPEMASAYHKNWLKTKQNIIARQTTYAK